MLIEEVLPTFSTPQPSNGPMDRFLSGRPLRPPQTGQEPRLRRLTVLTLALGHRRQQRHLQRGQRRGAAAAPVSRAAAADVHHQPVPGARIRPVLGVRPGIHRVQGLEPGVRVGWRLHGLGGQSRERPAEPPGDRHRHARAHPHPGRPARDGTGVQPGGYPARRGGCGHPLPRAVAAELRRLASDILDQIVPINGAPARVIGIMPPRFDVHDQKVELWLPLTLGPGGAPATAEVIIST
jgi:hypothetical protein